MKILPQISGAAPRMPSNTRSIIMHAMKIDENQSVSPGAIVKLLLDHKIDVTTITKPLFALGISPMDATVALESAKIDSNIVTQACHSLGAPQIPKHLVPEIQALKKKEGELLPSAIISHLKSRVELVIIARVLIAVGIDPAVAKEALKHAKYDARDVMTA
eukprot:TRINITY_DN944_c0_g1_i1.p1 TRINITY_DN944_c0_g1~~TRINITY_DN944_c0_g1_i1.p1  ORF type:complete len:161 (-),score=24.97 TRINITY_DN944_c0_g1_i1:185-667(-)